MNESLSFMSLLPSYLTLITLFHPPPSVSYIQAMPIVYIFQALQFYFLSFQLPTSSSSFPLLQSFLRSIYKFISACNMVWPVAVFLARFPIQRSHRNNSSRVWLWKTVPPCLAACRVSPWRPFCCIGWICCRLCVFNWVLFLCVCVEFVSGLCAYSRLIGWVLIEAC